TAVNILFAIAGGPSLSICLHKPQLSTRKLLNYNGRLRGKVLESEAAKRYLISSFWYPDSGPGGEIGRRKGLKIPRGKLRTGSIPVPGTTLQQSSGIV